MTQVASKLHSNDDNHSAGTSEAALILLSLGEPCTAKVFQHLEQEELKSLSEAMVKIGEFSQEKVNQAVEHFYHDYQEQSGIHTREYLEKSLNMALGEPLAGHVMKSLYGDDLRHTLMQLNWIESATLVQLLGNEHPQLQAVVLASLTPEKAHEVLLLLPESAHNDLLYRLANLKELQPETLLELEQVLDLFVDGLSRNQSCSVSGLNQAASLLGRMNKQHSQSILQVFRDNDNQLAESLVDAMLSFDSLAHQSDETLVRLMEEVPKTVMVNALKLAEPDVTDKLLNSLSGRSTRYLQDAMESQEPQPKIVVEEAQKEVLQTLRDLAEQGEVELRLFNEPMV